MRKLNDTVVGCVRVPVSYENTTVIRKDNVRWRIKSVRLLAR